MKLMVNDNISMIMIKICDKSLLKPVIYFKIQVNYLITQIYGKGVYLYPTNVCLTHLWKKF